MHQTLARNTELFIYRSLTADQIRSYNDDGFLSLGRVLSDSGIEQMRREAMAAWEDERHWSWRGM